MRKQLYPCLWFNRDAADAARLYCKAFSHCQIRDENPMVVNFTASGRRFMCLNGGPEFRPGPAISFFAFCKSRHETDQAWQTLAENGRVLMPLDSYNWSNYYGWIEDKYGVNWQIMHDDAGNAAQPFTPSLMFSGKAAGKAEEAMKYYTGLFSGSVMDIQHYTDEDDDTTGWIKYGSFKLGDNHFTAMDSSRLKNAEFNEGVSLVVECDTQEEIDHCWNSLTAEGQESRCGWLKDKYGVSWQIVPAILPELLADPGRADRVVNAFMKMNKFDIETLVNA